MPQRHSPNDDKFDVATQLQIKTARLRATLTGLVCGILAAIGLFVATNWLVVKGGPNPGEHLSLLGHYFIGYRVTFVGSFIGAAYAFAVGAACGFCLSLLYNALTNFRERRS